ncbi:MAG: hypothetical protein LBL74_04410 [Bacteroidales bacterium]|jgi:outer membrane biosynthesis protein TonB|nr:hypothetical protein [Bacteroidales bacterium]
MEQKRRIIALAITIAFFGLLISALLLMGLRYPEPPPPEMGVEMDMGSLTDVGNAIAGEKGGSDANTAVATPPSDEDNVATQNTEPAPLTAKPQIKKIESTKPQTKPDPAPVIDPNASFKKGMVKTGSGNGQGKGQGSGTGDGNNGGGGTGNDMTGSGVSFFSLAGRTVNRLPQPTKSISEKGIVVVTIYVNRDGKVIRANAGGRGTDIPNKTIWKICEQAALQSKFSPKPDAPEEQKGTITYKIK